jgi:hypothetical protein
MSQHEKSKVESLVGNLLLSNTAMSTNLEAAMDFACPPPRCLFKKGTMDGSYMYDYTVPTSSSNRRGQGYYHLCNAN